MTKLDPDVVVPPGDRERTTLFEYVQQIAIMDPEYKPDEWRDALDDIRGIVKEAKAIVAKVGDGQPVGPALFPVKVCYSNAMATERLNPNTHKWEVVDVQDICMGRHNTIYEAMECTEGLAKQLGAIKHSTETRLHVLILRQILEQVDTKQVDTKQVDPA